MCNLYSITTNQAAIAALFRVVLAINLAARHQGRQAKFHPHHHTSSSGLAVRDFLVQIGFADATVRGCGFYISADDKDGKQI